MKDKCHEFGKTPWHSLRLSLKLIAILLASDKLNYNTNILGCYLRYVAAAVCANSMHVRRQLRNYTEKLPTIQTFNSGGNCKIKIRLKSISLSHN